MNGHARHWIDGAWLDSAQRDNPSTRQRPADRHHTPTAGGPRPTRRSPPLCAPSKMVPGRTTTRCARQPWRKSPRPSSGMPMRSSTCLPWRTARSSPRLPSRSAWCRASCATTPAWRAANGRQRHAAPRRGVAGAARADGRRRHHRAVEFTGGADDPLPGAGAGRRYHHGGEDAGQTAQTNAMVARIIAEAPSLPAGAVNIFSESVPKAPGD